ncbi:MAG: CarD family transcriptional regulator [Candidatus Sumerlaeia bacterium]|nr:CarD family transcriptional regulator [Candidatus Sumerlaeia bacterium]
MMKFKIGETIIEPTNGICVMRGMKRMTVDGAEMTVYIFDAQSAKVFVPADQVERRNIRRPMSREEVKKVLAALKAPVSPNRNDARMQYNNYRDIMKSGDPMRISRLLRDLYILDEMDDLKGKEKEIMEQAKKFLCDEISFVRTASKLQVMEAINEALRQMYKKKVAKDKERAKKSGVGLPLEVLGYGDDEEDLEDDGGDGSDADDLDAVIERSAARRKKPAAAPAKGASKKAAALPDDEEEAESLDADFAEEEEEDEDEEE